MDEKEKQIVIRRIWKFINNCEAEIYGKSPNHQYHQFRKILAVSGLSTVFIKKHNLDAEFEQFQQEMLPKMAIRFSGNPNEDCIEYELQDFFKFFNWVKEYIEHTPRIVVRKK